MPKSWPAGPAALLLCGLLCAASASAGSRSQLQDQPFPGPKYHTVMVRAVVDPAGQVPPHTHPGLEMGYVIAGRAVLSVQGRPDQPLSTGDSFAIPPMTVHSVRNAGAAPLTILSTYVVETGKPVLSPAGKQP